MIIQNLSSVGEVEVVTRHCGMIPIYVANQRTAPAVGEAEGRRSARAALSSAENARAAGLCSKLDSTGFDLAQAMEASTRRGQSEPSLFNFSARIPKLIERQRHYQHTYDNEICPCHPWHDSKNPRAYYQPCSKYAVDKFLPRLENGQRQQFSQDNQKTRNYGCSCGR